MPVLFQRVDLPGARTGGLPPIGGSPSRGARIFPNKMRAPRDGDRHILNILQHLVKVFIFRANFDEHPWNNYELLQTFINIQQT